MPEAEQLLRENSLRVTAPRMAMLTVVCAQLYADVETIANSVRDRLGSVSTQAVYDVPRAFAQAQLVRRVEPAGSRARFESRVGDNHHHVVRRSCGEIDDVDCATGSAPCLEADDSREFVIDETEVTCWGLCPQCQQTPPSHSK